MTKEYTCECGKVFTTPNSFNGHKAGCKQHYLIKYGNLDILLAKRKQVALKCSTTNKKVANELKQEKLQQWISEKHLCEKCGKVMTEKFGSGRFCSRVCANGRTHSEDTLFKIKQSADINSDKLRLSKIQEYNQNPSLCEICGLSLDYEHRRKKTCSEQCKRLLASKNLKNNPSAGGLREGSGIGKHGWYKGYFCDSTYELVFVIYNIDHGIFFKRNKDYYSYTYKGKHLKYYPDFLMGDGSFIEIKGYHTDQVDAKIAAVTDRTLRVLYHDDLQYAFDWVKQNYDYKHLEDLYESK
jgi:hypothetical protein